MDSQIDRFLLKVILDEGALTTKILNQFYYRVQGWLEALLLSIQGYYVFLLVTIGEDFFVLGLLYSVYAFLY